MNDRSRISADEAISEIEEARIDTPATRAAFGDPGDAGVEAVADIPFPLQRIEDPPELDEELEEQVIDDEELDDDVEREEEQMPHLRCRYPNCGHDAFPTERGRNRHETVVHGSQYAGKKVRAGRKATRRGRPRSERAAIGGLKATGVVVDDATKLDELDQIRGILLAIGELSPTGRAFLLEQVAGE